MRIFMQEQVQGIVAHEGSGGVGDGGTQSGGTDGIGHMLHRDCGKISGGTVGSAAFPPGQMACVVPGFLDPGVPDVDGDALGGDGIPGGGQTHAEDHIGRIVLHGGDDGPGGGAEDGGDLQFGQAVIPKGVRQTGYGLPGGIDRSACEGIEAGDQQMFHRATSRIFTHHSIFYV